MTARALRQRVEAIVFDGYGSAPFALPAGRFTRTTAELAAVDASAERRVRVVIGLGVDGESGHNPLDGFVIRTRALVVEVEYQRTSAGGDLAEGYDAQNGPGSDDAIADRMSIDEHELRAALTWHEHWSGLDPYLISIASAGESETSFDGPIAVLRVAFTAQQRETSPGTYSP